MGSLSLIVLVAALGGGISLFLLLRAVMSGPSPQMRKRFDRVQERPMAKSRNPEQATLRRTEDDSVIPGLDDLVKRVLPRRAILHQRLRCTGLRINPGEYALACFLVGAVTGFVIHQFLPLSWILAGLAGLCVGLLVPHLVVTLLISRRIKHFIALFPEAIDLIVRGLRSGLPVPESIRTVGEEMKDPIGVEFRTVSEKIKLGVTLDEALKEMEERISVPEFRFFVISLSIQRETGGNLAETLENLSDILRKRRQMKLKIKAMSSEASASALILGSLPFALFGILSLVSYEYVLPLFTDPRGNMLLAAALVSLVVGVAVMMKMVRFEI